MTELNCKQCRFVGTFVYMGSEDILDEDDPDEIIGQTLLYECPACGHGTTLIDLEMPRPDYEDDGGVEELLLALNDDDDDYEWPAEEAGE